MNPGGTIPERAKAKMTQGQAKGMADLVQRILSNKDHFQELYANKKNIIDKRIQTLQNQIKDVQIQDLSDGSDGEISNLERSAKEIKLVVDHMKAEVGRRPSARELDIENLAEEQVSKLLSERSHIMDKAFGADMTIEKK